jgi:recombination protein RecT
MKYKETIAQVLPAHLTPEKALRLASTVIFRSPKLQQCTPVSLINAVIEISRLGLDIGRTAHIVPFGREAVMITDYKGEIQLAYNSGQITSYPVKAVYANDEFDYQEGTDRWIKHKPAHKDRGELVAAYAIINFVSGGYDFEVVHKEDAEAAKRVAPAGKSKDSPWNKPDQEHWMWIKTAVHRLSKRIPQSPELQRVIQLESQVEAGLKQEIDHVIEAEFTAESVPEAGKEATDKKDAVRKKLEGMNGEKEDPPVEDPPHPGGDPDPDPEPEPEDPLKCKICGFQAKSEKGLKRHTSISHKNDPVPPDENPQETPQQQNLEEWDTGAGEDPGEAIGDDLQADFYKEFRVHMEALETDLPVNMETFDEFMEIQWENKKKDFKTSKELKMGVMMYDHFEKVWGGYLKWMKEGGK